jgi:DNA-binding response OmpR family regulator
MSGLGLCRLLRESPFTHRIPFVLVSQRSAEIDRVLAFEAGADDFVPKPFFPSELGARVSAILKRSRNVDPALLDASLPSEGKVQLDPKRHLVTVDGKRVELSATEFTVLGLLMSQGGRVVCREEMIARLWGAEEQPSERIVDSHVKAIRRKLGPAGECIETVRGRGYRYEPGAA